MTYEKNDMVITAKDFRANQSKYIDIAHRGEEVILKSRRGSVKLIPVVTENIEKDHLLVDGTDTSLFEDDMTLPLPDRNLSVDELESLIIEDIHKIYEMK